MIPTLYNGGVLVVAALLGVVLGGPKFERMVREAREWNRR